MNYYETLVSQQSHRYRVYYHKRRILNTIGGKCEKNPISIEIHSSNICNSKCSFCAYKNRTCHEYLKPKYFQKLIDEIVGFKNIKSVVFSGGGEPSLNDYLSNAINQLVQNNIEVGVMTNGIYINDRLLESYARCSWIRISLNGFNAAVYSSITNLPKSKFDKVCNNIRKITKLKGEDNSLIVGISCVVDAHFTSTNNLLTFFDLAYNLRADYVMYRPYEGESEGDTSISRSEFEEILSTIGSYSEKYKITNNMKTFIKEKYKEKHDKKKVYSCPLSENGLILVVSADGGIHPCINSVKDKWPCQYSIQKNSLSEYLANINIDYSICSDCRYSHMNEEIRNNFPEENKVDRKDVHWKFL